MRVSLVVPTLDAERTLAPTLAALVPAAVSGLVKELIIADGGSRDRTLTIAEAAGARIVAAPRGRGAQLKAGAQAARGDWLMFLHADTVLDAGWEHEARRFIAEHPERAGYFRFRLDDRRWRARALERAVALRCALLSLPYGDQGLLISRRLHDAAGGFRALPLMEDVDLARRLGRRRLRRLEANAVTSAARYRRDGYARRVTRNAFCLSLWLCGVPAERIARLYG